MNESVKEWQKYWDQDRSSRFIYNLIASFYRNYIIRGSLNHFVKTTFKKGAKVIHAGSGGGETDKDIKNYLQITAVDFSENALKQYKKTNGKASKTVLADIFNMPFKSSSFNGLYNLGVMEHYTQKEIKKLLKEFDRVLKKKAKIILFWPPEFGLSVVFFKILVFIYKNVLQIKRVKFHPKEVTRIRSKKHVKQLFKNSNFKIVGEYFGIRDLFTYYVIIAQKK
jgi:ubiquinone/menaquinone biosynthesis C-methylase UbiE